jgi:cell division protein FtsW (lipid II flippase)
VTALATLTKARPRRRSEFGLLLVGVIIALYAYVLAYLGVYGSMPSDLVRFAGILVGTAVVINAVNRVLVPEADPILVPVVLVLNSLGYALMVRLQEFETRAVPHLAGNFAIYSMLGVLAYVITLVVVKRSRDLERYRYLILLLAILLLILPLVPHIGYAINGARLWVQFGPVSFQPVEFGKILLVVFFASYFVEKRELLTLRTNRIGNHLVPDLRGFGPVALAWAASLAVILLEKDIGFSLLLFLVFLIMLWAATGRWSYVLIGIIAFVVGTYFAAKVLPLIDQRIQIWLDPWKYTALNTNQTGLQSVTAEIHMAVGGLSGTGLGLGTPWEIPVAEQDMAFSAFAEELGLIGASAILVGYALIIGSGLRSAIRARSDFSKLLALGLTANIGFQTFFIIAGNLRVLPFTGITLPFMSYGGSSLVANFILIGLLMRVSQEGSESRAAHARTERVSRRERRRVAAATTAIPAVTSG